MQSRLPITHFPRGSRNSNVSLRLLHKYLPCDENMAVMVRARCLTIMLKNSLNTLSYFPNYITRQVFSSAYSTNGTQRLDSIVLQVSKFRYTSISIPLPRKVLVKAERCFVTLNTRYTCLWDHKQETSQPMMKEKSEHLNFLNTTLNNTQN